MERFIPFFIGGTVAFILGGVFSSLALTFGGFTVTVGSLFLIWLSETLKDRKALRVASIARNQRIF